jgi:ubiquinone/menaquinone biosynthesis C-methylase UbiE
MRVLEIGCGPGAAAREVSRRIGDGFVHAIDRSSKAIAQAIAVSETELATKRLEFLQVSIEDFELAGEERFDLAFAIRVGALDGRHPNALRHSSADFEAS